MGKVILLFDMDGVLIRSAGYYTSLQSAVKLIGRVLGIRNAVLSMEEISRLEAVGIFHIWDHLTFFSSVLLLHSWKVDPTLRIPADFKSPEKENQIIPTINFEEYTKDLLPDQFRSMVELSKLFVEHGYQLDNDQQEYLNWLIGSSREIYVSPVLPIMQEYILGSDQFDRTYSLSSQLDVRSFPEELDRPALSKENYVLLHNWLKADDNHAAIFTSRPNLPPDKDFFGTPEAEIGARITDLEYLPIIGAGSLDWMADQDRVPARSYNKPSPVHALAALQAAIGQDIRTSLMNATDITTQLRNSQKISDWLALNGATVYVFEDSLGGMESAQSAAKILSNEGVSVEMKLIGIGHQPDKIESLLDLVDQVYRDINSSPLIEIITAE
jgi:hypothetical protein